MPKSAAALLTAAALAAATPAFSDPGNSRVPSALMAGAPRLAFYTVMREKPRGSERFLRSFLRSNGFAHPPHSAPKLLSATLQAQPLVSYDSNVNNGLPGEEIRLGPYIFKVDPEDTAKQDVLAGGRLAAAAAYSVGKGKILSGSVSAAYQHALNFDIDRRELAANACFRSLAAAWTWVDLCGGSRHVEQVSEVRESYVSGRVSRLLSSALANHEASAELKRVFHEDYGQTLVTLGLTNAAAGLGALSAHVTAGQRVEGEHALKWGTRLSLTRRVFRRQASLSVSLRKYGGSKPFGIPRDDTQAQIRLSADVIKKVTVGIGYKATRSSIDIYDEAEPTIDFAIKPWVF